MGRSDDVRKQVSESYARAVRKAVQRRNERASGREGKGSSPSPSQGRGCCCQKGPVSDALLARMAGYSSEQMAALPPEAVVSSFGCGNPLALAAIRPGDTVLDLGSGAGMDLLLAAKMTGPSGRVIGVDMTAEMIERARANAAAAGLENVELRQGIIENLPVEDGSVDLVISNCVINLSPEKNRVFRELVRVLRPNGRISISDIVSEPLPEWIQAEAELYTACISGAIPEVEYLDGLRQAGLCDVTVSDRLVYSSEQLQGLLGSVDTGGCCGTGGLTGEKAVRFSSELAGKVSSVRVVGRKPEGQGRIES